MGRPDLCRALMNEVNGSPILPLPEYMSSCSPGNRSKRSPPSSNRRQRETPLTNIWWIRRVFMLINELRSWRHSTALSTPRLSSSGDHICNTPGSRVRRSTGESICLSELQICAIGDNCQSQSRPVSAVTAMEKGYISVSPRG